MNSEDISEEIIRPNLDLSKDYAEIVLDEFFDDGILKDVPIVRTLVAVAKTGAAIKERFFIKKFLVFLKELHSGIEKHEELEEFRIRFDTQKDFRSKTTEQVMLVIEQLDSVKKAQISAHLFRAYIEKKYDWDRYVALNTCLRTLQEMTYPVIQILSEHNFSNFNSPPAIDGFKEFITPQIEKEKFSFYLREYQALITAAGIASISGSYFSITPLGQDLYTYGISKIV